MVLERARLRPRGRAGARERISGAHIDVFVPTRRRSSRAGATMCANITFRASSSSHSPGRGRSLGCCLALSSNAQKERGGRGETQTDRERERELVAERYSCKLVQWSSGSAQLGSEFLPPIGRIGERERVRPYRSSLSPSRSWMTANTKQRPPAKSHVRPSVLLLFGRCRSVAQRSTGDDC